MKINDVVEKNYFNEDEIDKIIEKIQFEIPGALTVYKQELLCVINDIINTEPCLYWNKSVFEATITNLQNYVSMGKELKIDEDIFEFFISGYNAYLQITEIINDLSNVNYNPATKNRIYRIPTYVSIVEGCLTNLFRFIALLVNQTTEKDYSSTSKLKPLCEILEKNGFDKLTGPVNINIRNAINHGGIIFKDDGAQIVFHYTQAGKSVSSTLSVYDFDDLINAVYDNASAIVLGIAAFINNNWSIINIDVCSNTFSAFNIMGMKLSLPSIRCKYINDVPSCNQINAEFWISNTDREFIINKALELAILIYAQYPQYDKYFISFYNERLSSSWIRFSNLELKDIVSCNRDAVSVLNEIFANKEGMIFNPSNEIIDLQEIKYFRFPILKKEHYSIKQIEDVSTPDRKRLKCRLYIGSECDKNNILKLIKESIEWLKCLRNVDSPTMHHKNGDMEADALYINVYRFDARRNKAIHPNNDNFVCFVDYNLNGETTLVNGGIFKEIWQKFHHEKIENMTIAWKDAKYMARRVTKIEVNSPCPCGSGIKYKKCCKGKGIFD